uniref:Phospholipid/glycerol acyltransferase domain-containing protein n=1 Tax=Romanomermis culicivorax TaxID=13658 RepID=A0A915JFX5_ROMCU
MRLYFSGSMTGVNPFVNRAKIDSWRYGFQILFMTLFVVPFRLTIYVIFFFVTYCLAFVASLIDNDFSRPLSGIRMCLFHLMNELIVWGHVLGIGFQVKIVGERAPAHVAPILVCAPHSSFFDVLAHCSIGTPTVVGKIGLFSAPMIGRMLCLTVPIIIDRKDKEGRRQAMGTISRRASELFASNPQPTKSNFCGRKIFRNAVIWNENCIKNPWPQICIFPEGTCTNRTQLITFRAGAFHPGLPVQPICFKWLADQPHDVVSWTWEGASLVRLMWLAMCNISNKLEIYYLPVYVPNELEKLDPHLFARNVRQKMAEYLNIPVSEFTLDDAIYLTDYGRPTMEQFRSLCQNAG